MWLLNLIEWADNLVDRGIALVFCSHDWEYVRDVREQSLRGGFDHTSSLYECRVCGKFKTVEHAVNTDSTGALNETQ